MAAKEKLVESVHVWRDVVVKNANDDSLNAFTDSVISTSGDLDKMSGWAIGAAGAIAGLMIANVDKIGVEFYEKTEIKVMLLILVISILCGLGQKSLAVSCSLYNRVKEVLSTKLKGVIATFESSEQAIEKMAKDNGFDIDIEFDMAASVDRFVKISPFYIRWLVKKEITRTLADSEYSAKKILATYYRQSIWLMSQGLFFIGFILFAVCSL